MKEFRRLTKIAAIAAAGLLRCSQGVSSEPFRPPEPGATTIYRDHMGVPHIFGYSEAEAFFGAGYALGQDRLVQAELDLRRARGRLAQILGTPAVQSDREARIRAPTDEELLQAFQLVPPQAQRLIRATVSGLNAAIAQANADPDHRLPYEYAQWGIRPQPWSLLDYLAAYSRNRLAYGSSGGAELTNLEFYHFLVRKYGANKAKAIFDDVLPLDDPSAVPIVSADEFKFGETHTAVSRSVVEAQLRASRWALQSSSDSIALMQGFEFGQQVTHAAAGASRAFVVGGRKSASGHVMMLEATSEGPDIHLVGGHLNAVGFTVVPGVAPIMGRNEKFGWLTTTGEDDTVDIFAERLDPHDKYRYRYKESWRRMHVRRETIKVKDAPDVVVEIANTVHGPVVAWNELEKTAYTEQNSLRGYQMQDWAARLEMAEAGSRSEFAHAVGRIPTSTNILYGDQDGHIEFWHVGRLPRRAPGVDPRLPTPGTGQYEWRGIIPFAELPHVRDPAAGFLHAWNNKPAVGMTYGDSSRYGVSFRTWLGLKLGSAKPVLTMDDMRLINRKMGRSAGGVDLSVTDPHLFTPFLREAAGSDPRLMEAVELIESWDGVFEDADGDGHYDNPGLTIFRAWIPIAQQQIIGSTIGDWWSIIDSKKYIKYRTDVLLRAIQGQAAPLPMHYDWFGGRSRQSVLRATLARTLTELEATYRSGDMHSWRMPIYWRYYDPSQSAANPDKPQIRNGGAGTTAARLHQAPAFIPDNLSEEWNVLMEIGTGEPPLIQDSTPLGGQSQFVDVAGHAGAHVSDQVLLHENFDFKTVQMDPSLIAAESESVTHLKADGLN